MNEDTEKEDTGLTDEELRHAIEHTWAAVLQWRDMLSTRALESVSHHDLSDLVQRVIRIIGGGPESVSRDRINAMADEMIAERE